MLLSGAIALAPLAIVFIALLCLSAMLCAAPGYAEEAPLLTHAYREELFTHGEPFQFACEQGSYLVGFDGRVGAWIDQLRLVCARWNAVSGRFEQPVTADDMEIGWSQGGKPAPKVVCPDDSGIAGAYDDRPSARYGNIYVLQKIEFHCVRAADGTRPKWRQFGTSAGSHGGVKPLSGCPEGYLAIGIHGRSGKFVDTLFGFVCRRRPWVSPVAANKPSGNVEIVNPRLANAPSGKLKGGIMSRSGADIDTGGGAPPPPPPPPPPAKQTATAKADVNIHSQGSGQSPVIGILRQGRTVEVLGHDPEKDWYKLQFKGVPGVPDGPGWVSATWLTISP